jgi:hypothetical protein
VKVNGIEVVCFGLAKLYYNHRAQHYDFLYCKQNCHSHTSPVGELLFSTHLHSQSNLSALLSMPSATCFTGEWIWGDDAESEVFAQGYGDQLTVIFRFKQNQNADPPSLANRIVSCYFEAGEEHGFASREEMREALWAAVQEV